ncbi:MULTISPECIES: phosphate ABC transporter substrate-binding protein [Anoxybacillus]|uniref:PBP domain-containing protein n=1 Tax=Anoxybacillus ayderensis TaxID=265546 RepID=A0A0D0G5U7_9BACL|nr:MULTISPECIES: phosphate ABC transporter substrate-binding protein [Anoxybacillus]EPZ38865.1 phosphate binding protein [Anoxybacillus ayderensis]KIP20740.1 hypothetical protein JV16_02039 [Anoxybacillus ayderensis]NNU97172.1 phosphate ABC transporter substrate-binding protein [Anoxybacillus sp. EFIL]
MNLKSFIKKFSLVALSTSLLFGSSLAVTEKTEAAQQKGKIVIAGSSALLPLTQQAAKEFKKANPKVAVSVSGTASIVGPQSVSKGSATIGACDWDATKPVPGFNAFKGLNAYPIAIIPFATIVHKDNPVKNLTTKQLQDIFAGKIKNWKEVGGKDEPIIVINRVHGSGTRVNYQLGALKGAPFMTQGENYKEVLSNGNMIEAVRTTPNAIGYTDLAYIKGDIKAVAYNGVEPTVQNVINGKYPVWGYGYLLTKGPATGANKAFIDFVQSKKFQEGSLKKLKFIPITAMKKK